MQYRHILYKFIGIIKKKMDMDMDMDMDNSRQTKEIHYMFDIAEKVVMEYICYFLHKPPCEIFVADNMDNYTKSPFILRPIEGTDKFLTFTLEMVPHTYISNIPDTILSNKIVNEGLEFIVSSVQQVFNTIMYNSVKPELTNDVVDASFHLEFDEKSNTFCPVYIYPKRRQQLLFLKHKEAMDRIRPGITDTPQQAEFDECYSNIQILIDSSTFDATEASEAETEANTKFETRNKIGIIFKEVSADELPDNYQ